MKPKILYISTVCLHKYETDLYVTKESEIYIRCGRRQRRQKALKIESLIVWPLGRRHENCCLGQHSAEPTGCTRPAVEMPGLTSILVDRIRSIKSVRWLDCHPFCRRCSKNSPKRPFGRRPARINDEFHLVHIITGRENATVRDSTNPQKIPPKFH